jgi:hypothetical protein
LREFRLCGVLVTTRRKVVIENNRFDRITMSAVLISDDAESCLMAQDALHGFTEQEINLTEDITTND